MKAQQEKIPEETKGKLVSPEEDKAKVVNDVEDEEGQEPRNKRAPGAPTKEEREQHACTHIPYREWCKHCVRGRGRAGPRVEEEEDEDDLTRLVMDYCYLGKDKGKTMEGEESDVEEDDSDLPVLVAKMRKTGKVAATPVPREGDIRTQYTGLRRRYNARELERCWLGQIKKQHYGSYWNRCS